METSDAVNKFRQRWWHWRRRLDNDTVVLLEKHRQFIPLKGLRGGFAQMKPQGAFDVSKSIVQMLQYADIFLVQTKPQQCISGEL